MPLLLLPQSEVVSGAGAVAFGFSEALSGTETAAGTGALTFAYSEAAAGAETFTGTADVAFAFALDAAGELPAEDIEGSGGVEFGFSVAATEAAGTILIHGPVVVTYPGRRRRPTAAEPIPQPIVVGEAAVEFGFSVALRGDVNDDDLVILLAA